MRSLLSHLRSALLRRIGRVPEASPAGRKTRGPVDHFVLLDGTMGALEPARMTSIGLLYDFLRQSIPRASVYYGQGLEWREWRDLADLWFGWGVHAQILRAYGWLATRYRPGDRIFLLGYSRGAFAVRSLVGLIDRVGLLRPEAATERNLNLVWRYYEARELPAVARLFRARYCHEAAPIEMVGAFDTVRALGWQLPFLWMLSEPRYRFHDHRLGASVGHGFQALALNETRSVLEPLIWDSGAVDTRIEQLWFRGCHADIGGQLGAFEAARPLANIPLVWMIERMEALGVTLPPGWRAAFPRDPAAPMVGTWRGWGKVFLLRAPRVVGRDASERLHETAVSAARDWRILLRPRLRAALRAGARDGQGRGGPAGSAAGAHQQAGGGSDRIETSIGGAPDLAARDAG